MAINNPPSGQAAQLNWAIQSIQTIWKKLNGVAQSPVMTMSTGSLSAVGNSTVTSFSTSIPSGYSRGFFSIRNGAATTTDGPVVTGYAISGTTLTVNIIGSGGSPISGTYTVDYLLT